MTRIAALRAFRIGNALRGPGPSETLFVPRNLEPRPIDERTTDGFIPRADWNPATSPGSWMQGDGKLLYCGVHGPIMSARLANIRDGMEDYDRT